MIKIINDFLPKPLFDYLLSVVEHDTLNWNWNDRNLEANNTTPGGNEVKLGKANIELNQHKKIKQIQTTF